MNVLLIKGGVVDNCIEAASVALAQQFYPGHICIERTGGMSAGPGDTFDGVTFTARVVPAAPPDRHITVLAFLNRFTDPEAVSVDLASQGVTVQAAAMRRYWSKVNVATSIGLDTPETRVGVQTLESIGLIGPGRAAVILDSPVMQSERPALAQG